MKTMIERFKQARMVSTPLIAIRTSDPSATIRGIKEEFEKSENGTKGGISPMLSWDIIRGLTAINNTGPKVIAELFPKKDEEQIRDETGNLGMTLSILTKAPKRTCVFIHNIQNYIRLPDVVQGIWNLRDEFKTDQRTLVLLCPSMTLPEELSQDVYILDEPLPTVEELAQVVKDMYTMAQKNVAITNPTPELVAKATDALCGLSAFSAEQVTAMSISESGLAVEELWERKRLTIEQTPGLSVWRGKENFETLGGVANLKNFLRKVLNGNEPPRAIVFIDEIEKAMAGQNDSSGVSQSMTGTLLSWMQDNEATGIILIGPPGTGKSHIAKATGNEGGIPTIAFDLTGMKDSLVGSSEARLRAALKVVSAVSQGRTLFIATCNSIAVLPPELRRRFTFGTFFVPLPEKDEKQAIWKIYKTKFKLTDPDLPPDEQWTGSDIRQACELAYRLNVGLVEAATYFTPVYRSASEQLDKLSKEASGKFICASYPGYYEHNRPKAIPSKANTRKFNIEIGD